MRRSGTALALLASVVGVAIVLLTAPAHAIVPDEVVLRYAPVVRLHPSDDDRPMSTARFIGHSQLRWSHASGCDDHRVRPPNGRLNPRSLSSPVSGYAHRQVGEGCEGHQGRRYFAGEMTRPREDGNPFADQPEGFFLELNNGYRTGTGTDAPVYYEIRGDPRSITYWFLYGFNQGPGPTGVDNHEGDWERISVRLDDDNNATHVLYYQHDGSCVLPWSAAPHRGSGRPIVYSANGSHASYPWPGRYSLAGGLATDDAAPGPRWRTASNARDLFAQNWYGYGGGWGEVGNFTSSTGPLGPSPYKVGPGDGFGGEACERPEADAS